MNNGVKKFIAALTAATLSATLMVFPSASENNSPLFFSECEDAELTSDLQVTTNIYGVEKSGYSGDGFVWMQSGGTLTFEVSAPETGMYSIDLRYMMELDEGPRMQELHINGLKKESFMLTYSTEWSDYSLGVQRLEKGMNTVQIKAGWGHSYFDTLTVDYADLDPLNVSPILADKQALPETQSLMNYLTSVYGKNIISGQQEVYGNGHDGDMEFEFEWLYNLTGKYPAIRGFDYMNYNPLYGWDDETTERIIDWVKNRNGIATVCWHIHVPNDFDAYTLGEFVDWEDTTYKPEQTNFITENALIKGTKEHDYLMLAIDDLAVELIRLQDSGVPVIFRPYHEPEGNGPNGGAWFWWGSGDAEVYKDLWIHLFETLTEDYGLHNLIWEFNSYTYDTSPAWYPGDEWVDMVGYDKYNTIYNRNDGLSGVPNEDALSSVFYKLVELTGGKKMVAMAENDTIPSIENLLVEKAGWLYFCPWYGDFLMSENFNHQDTLIDVYQSDYTITLDELPANLYDGGVANPLAGDVNCDGQVNTEDLLLLKKFVLGKSSLSSQGSQNADLNSDDNINSIDIVLLIRLIATSNS